MLTRDLIALRKHRRLLSGVYEAVAAPEDVWAFRRAGGAYVALNLGGGPVRLEGVEGAIVIGSDRDRDDEVLDGTLKLRGREAVIVATS